MTRKELLGSIIDATIDGRTEDARASLSEVMTQITAQVVVESDDFKITDADYAKWSSTVASHFKGKEASDDEVLDYIHEMLDNDPKMDASDEDREKVASKICSMSKKAGE